LNFSSNRWKKLAGISLKESRAMGSDDSVDGAYTEVSPLQPMDQDPRRLREDNEERYPETASEYADELNAKHGGTSKLVSDQDHWEKSDVFSGKDLARYLAIASYSDAYKEANGIRPSLSRLKHMSISEIENMTDEVWKSHEDMGVYDYPEEEEYPVDFGTDDPEPEKYSEYEDNMDKKNYGRSF